MLSPSGAVDVAHAPLDHGCTDEPARDQSEAGADLRQLARDLQEFRDPRVGRSCWELTVTLVPFMLLGTTMLFAVQAGRFVALLLSVPTGLLLLRLFLIQHDCGHGSFLPSRSANDWLGRALGVLTLTPYDCWRRSHALHHASTGNLDQRGFGDIDTLTVREFCERTGVGKLLYRLYRHPLVLLGVGPAYQFLLRNRLPIGLMRAGRIYWVSAMATNAATALLLAGLAHAFGLNVVLPVILPVLLTAASIGVWLFFIQHQFEEAQWDRSDAWAFHNAAVHGSSHLELPPLLGWVTANIGVHHVHHLSSRIPFYRLPEALRAHPALRPLNRFTALQTFGKLRLTLWDEQNRRLVTFAEARSLIGFYGIRA